jgi:murein DD-endopeptidase MepM/ murein hydrolase activator NlpD
MATTLMHSVVQDYLTPLTLAYGAAQALPWAKNAFYQWAGGLPHGETDGIYRMSKYFKSAGTGVIDMGTISYDGYNGRASFLCQPFIESKTTYITSHYYDDRGPEYWPHPGIDYGTNQVMGDVVTAPMGGKVVFVGIYGPWGYTVIIENRGYQTLFSHATEVLVNAGAEITAGTPLMTIGGANQDERDGSSSGAHLHFEVRVCGQGAEGDASCQAVDPPSVFLPGQTEVCNWTDLVTSPELNSQPTPAK